MTAPLAIRNLGRAPSLQHSTHDTQNPEVPLPDNPERTHTRRGFVVIVPFAGLALLAACSDKQATPVAPPAPLPSGASTAPAPVVPIASVTPAPAPTQAAPTSPAASAGAGAALPALAPSDPTAVALGYVVVASQADAAKYPKYAAGQACGNCALFGGKPGDASGPCPLFAGRSVSAVAWCSGYTKKAV